MARAATIEAIGAWQAGLGSEAVFSDIQTLENYACCTCGSERTISVVLKPVDLDQVQHLVAIANEYKVPLYPISGGRQWGMGSRLPVRSGAAVVDLSRMNRIIEVNVPFHYAVVEPGVTQGQLLDHIRQHHLPLMLNVTGAPSNTSLIGNALDRGVGYFQLRAEGLSNLTVVLGNGETIHTGFGHYEQAASKNLYCHGIGPSLDGLFPQSSFGIVTSACIDLIPAAETHMAAVVKIDAEEKLPRLIDALVALRKRGVVNTIAHIGSRERTFSALAPLLYEQLIAEGKSENEATRRLAVQTLEKAGFGPWSSSVGILGTAAQLKLARKEIRTAVGGFARVLFLTDRKVRWAAAVAEKLLFIPAVKTQYRLLKAGEPIYRLSCGEATDVALKGFYWAANDFQSLENPDPDQSDCGLLFCVPLIPASGKTVQEVVRITREHFAAHGFEAGITVNLMNSKAIEGVISLSFDRRDKARAEKARACIFSMDKKYVELGYPPLRVGINSMPAIIQEDDPFWRTVRDLKTVLDPNNIMAPGRYNPA